MVKAVVEFEYDAELPDELSLRKGDIITNIKKQDGGWWEGTVNGKTGVFPDNFVKEIPDDTPKKGAPAVIAAPLLVAPPEVKSEPRIGHASVEAKKANVNVKALAAGAQPPLLGKRTAGKTKRARVTFAYAPEQPDEVELRLGDIVEIVKQEEEGWWEGIVNGKQGVFPSNFVEIIDIDDQPQDNETSTNVNDTTTKKLPGVMGYGDIFKGGQIQLKPSKENPVKVAAKDPVLTSTNSGNVAPPAATTGTGRGINSAPPPFTNASHVHSGSVGTAPSDVPGTGKKKDRARVLYAYQAENEDELTLEEGAIVTVLDRNLEDPGWWKGELNGRVGVFPDNFVDVIPPGDTPPPRPVKPHPVSAAAKADTNLQPDVPQRRDPDKTFPTSAVPPSSVVSAAAPVVPLKPANQTNRAPAAAQLTSSKSQESIAGKPAVPVASLTPRLASSESKQSGPPAEDPNGFEVTSVSGNVTTSRANIPSKRPPGGFAAPGHLPVGFASSGHSSSAMRTSGHTSSATGTSGHPLQVPRDHHGDGPYGDSTGDGSTHDYTRKPIGGVGGAQPGSVAAGSGGGGAAAAALVPDTGRLLEELRKEVHELRTAVLKQSDMERELKGLRDYVDSTRKEILQRLNDVLREVDEEKKIRLATQVDMERIKKLTMAQQQSPAAQR